MIISFEGRDGTGKSTQAHILSDTLKKLNNKVKLIHFPRYEQPVGSLIKKILTKEETLSKDALQMLYVADQLDFQEELKSYLKDGYIIILDRYDLSTIVYYMSQFPYGERNKAFNLITSWQDTLLRPDLTFILINKNNNKLIKDNKDFFEDNNHLMNEVNENYINISRYFADNNIPSNFWYIQAEGKIEEVAGTILDIVKSELSI